MRNQGYSYFDPITHGRSYDESYYTYLQQYAPQQDAHLHTDQLQHQHACYQQLCYASASQRSQAPELAPGISVPLAAATYGGQIVDSGGAVSQRQQFGNVYDQTHPVLNPAAAAAVSALSQLAQFAGTMDAAERAMSGMHLKNHVFGPLSRHGSFPPEVHHKRLSIAGGNRRSFWGKGHGRGMFKARHTSESQGVARSSSAAASGDLAAQNHKLRQQHAWCELCGVDCNSLEILEHHRNGKRHKRNMELANIQEQASGPKPGEDEESKIVENVALENDNGGPRTQSMEKKPKDQEQENPRAGFCSSKGRGMKHKVGGSGRKRRKTLGTQRLPGRPRQQKVVIPLICDLCNVKCDTQNVFERHVSGKKHNSKKKQFECHRVMFGPVGLQSLYPPNPLSQSRFILQEPQPPPVAGETSSDHAISSSNTQATGSQMQVAVDSCLGNSRL